MFRGNEEVSNDNEDDDIVLDVFFSLGLPQKSLSMENQG